MSRPGQGRAGEACAAGTKAIQGAAGLRSRRSSRYVLGLGRRLAAYADQPEVLAFGRRLAAYADQPELRGFSERAARLTAARAGPR